MGWIWSRLGFLLCLVHVSYQTEYYTAAVVAYHPTFIMEDPVKSLRSNSLMYAELIGQAKEQNADIIVFPENGLTGIMISSAAHMNPWTSVIPSADTKSIPCVENLRGISETMMQISCAARKNKIYVVVNMVEKVICESTSDNACSSKGTHYFNTNVVFDRQGAIIARYRKTHLINEPRFSVTKTPEMVTFDTDFGVKFGIFTCFDIVFPVPSLNLTRLEGVTNIVYPTAWPNEVPFLTSVQIQYSWAYTENVNLLSAGYSWPDIGVEGSGIYIGRRGVATVNFSNRNVSRLMVARVPKTGVREPRNQTIRAPLNDVKVPYYAAQRMPVMMDGIAMMRDNIKVYETVRMKGDYLAERICQRGFCCDFEVRTTENNDNSPINYRAVVYNGGRLFSTNIKTGISVCAVVQCNGETTDSCTTVNRSDITFIDLNIRTTFNDYSQFLVAPNTLDSSMLPLEQFYYKENIRKNQMTAMISLSRRTKNLVAFGIYARNYKAN